MFVIVAEVRIANRLDVWLRSQSNSSSVAMSLQDLQDLYSSDLSNGGSSWEELDPVEVEGNAFHGR